MNIFRVPPLLVVASVRLIRDVEACSSIHSAPPGPARAHPHHIDYISLQRSEADLSVVADLCSSLFRDATHLWRNRKRLKSQLQARLTANREQRFGLVKGQAKKQGPSESPMRQHAQSLLQRTATVATQTASMVAMAALRSSPAHVTKCHVDYDEKYWDEFCSGNTNAEFEDFNNVPVSTCLVSTQDPYENSALLAKLKTKKHGTRRATPTHKEDETEVAGTAKTAAESALDRALLQRLTDPLIPQMVWDRLTGKEFPQNMELLQGLAQTGYQLASQDYSNDWVAWTKVSSTFKESLEEGAIHVWTGQAVVNHNKGCNSQYYGASASFIKTRSIIPLTPGEVMELMLDSSRVKTYNKWSIGRTDLWVSGDERTKIVQNTNQVPMGTKPLRSTTLLHACPVPGTTTIDGNTSWLLLSRAIGPISKSNSSNSSDDNQGVNDNDEDVNTSDILLGVNLVQPLGDGESSILTAITHVYSNAVPGILAQQLGVQSATKFVKDLRALAVPASSPSR